MHALQLPLCKNPEGYEKRKFFWEDNKTLSFDKIVKKYSPYTFTEKLKDKIKVFIKNK